MKYPEFEEIENNFFAITTLFSMSYIHGVVCACVCKQDKNFLDDFLLDIIRKNEYKGFGYIDDSLIQDYKAGINEIYNITNQSIIEETNFQLFLPDDDEPIIHRLQYLIDWCQGFLDGVQSHLDELTLSEDVNDAIDNIQEIITMDLTDIVEDEEYEKYYVEIVEYLKVTVLYAYLELMWER